jgi:septum formation protein
MKLVLASSSPRRAEILRNAGFAFTVRPAHADEARFPNESAQDYVRRLANLKARLVADGIPGSDDSRSVVIGADTVVLAQGQILGKPEGTDDARRMLRLLSGKAHEVLSGLSVIAIPNGPEYDHVETTTVQFLDLSDADIEEYVETGEPLDKAGAYGIQGAGGRFVWRIEGCYFNVMGLPVSRLWSILNLFRSGSREVSALEKQG